MKKGMTLAGFMALVMLALVLAVSCQTQKTSTQTQTAIREQTTPPSATVKPAEGTVAWWDDDTVWDSGSRDRWLDSEYQFMHTVVGPVAGTTERWLGSVAPDLVYVEANKCKGNLRLSESEACEIKLSKKMEKMFHKCSDSRPSDVRSCVVSLDPEVGSEEKAEWAKIGQR